MSKYKKIKIKTDNKSFINKGLTNTWINYQTKVLQLLIRKDSRFMFSWKPIKQSMFIDNCLDEANELRLGLANFNKLKKENFLGNPLINLYTGSSGNTIHHLYSIYSLIKKTNISFSTIKSVVEFGGGYGNFCKLVYRLKFNSNYKIVDLPIFLEIQKWYLNELESEERINFGVKGSKYFKVEFQSINTSIRTDLFVALWSLSETSLDFRKGYESLIFNSNYILIAFQKKFENMDNLNYFENLKSQLINHWVDIFEIKHLPNHFYLIGKKIVK